MLFGSAESALPFVTAACRALAHRNRELPRVRSNEPMPKGISDTQEVPSARLRPAGDGDALLEEIC